MTAAIVSQGKKGAEWQYDLESVYSVMFTSFHFSHLSEALLRDVRLSDSKTHELFSDKMRMIFIALPSMTKEWEECDTELERLIYPVKNMETLDKNTAPYKSSNYEDMFEASEEVNLSPDEVVPYPGPSGASSTGNIASICIKRKTKLKQQPK